MKCPFCGSCNHRVIDKRAVNGLGEIRRRRKCLKCIRRFTTYERIACFELVVVKKDGRKEAFDREKLMAGIVKALEKRPALGVAGELAEKIEMRLLKKSNKEVSSKLIGNMVLAGLKRLDSVAYLRFASVYRRFDNPEDFAKEASALVS